LEEKLFFFFQPFNTGSIFLSGWWVGKGKIKVANGVVHIVIFLYNMLATDLPLFSCRGVCNMVCVRWLCAWKHDIANMEKRSQFLITVCFTVPVDVSSLGFLNTSLMLNLKYSNIYYRSTYKHI